MRMWGVNPRLMCAKHLLGEHVEMHMFKGTIIKGRSIQGYVENHLVEVHKIKERHDELALEMTQRGYAHNSPLEEFKMWKEGTLDRNENLKELSRRCDMCSRLR